MYFNKQLYDKIVNPNTGKQVKINSSIGKKIVKNYLSIINSNGGSNYNINTIKEIARKFNNIKSNDIQKFLSSLEKLPKQSSINVFEKIIKWVSYKENVKIKKYINPDIFIDIFKNYQIGGSGIRDKERERERDIDWDTNSYQDRERERHEVNQNVSAQPYNYNGELIYHGQHIRDLRQRAQDNAEEAEKYKIGAAFGAVLLFILWYWQSSNNST